MPYIIRMNRNTYYHTLFELELGTPEDIFTTTDSIEVMFLKYAN